MGIEDKFEWNNIEEDPFFHSIGKYDTDPKGNKVFYDYSVDATVLAKKQDDLPGLKNMVMRGVKTSSVILFPLLIGLAVCAEPIVLLMLTEKWLPCVPYLQVLSIALMLRPVQTANLQGILAIGRSDVFLKIQMIQKLIGIVMIFITIFLFNDPFAVAVGELISYILFACINAYPNKKFLNYSFKEQVLNLLPQLIIAGLMGGLVYLIGFLQVGTLFLLILQVLTGAVFYIGVMYLFKVDAFMYLWRMLLGVFNKFRKKEQ